MFDVKNPQRTADKSHTDRRGAVQASHHGSYDGPPLLGTLCLLAGAVLSGLAFVEETAGLPFRMPRSWYADRPLWYGLIAVLFVAGFFLLRRRRPISDSWRPSRPGIRFRRLVLYTRTRCHLCDQAKETLLQHRSFLPEVEEVDVDTDPELVERFGTCVPVVEIDGKVRFRGEVNESLLRRLIEGTPPRPPEGSEV